MKRRSFLQKAAVGTSAYAGTNLFGYAMPNAEAFSSGGGIGIEEGLYLLEQGKEKNSMPEIRPEIKNNPRAVFLIETNVEARRSPEGFFSEAQEQIEETAKSIAGRIFVKGAKKGGSTLILPNLTWVPDVVNYPTCGTNTSHDFIIGFAQGLAALDNSNTITMARGSNVVDHRKSGLYAKLDSIELKLIEAKYLEFSHYTKNELNWHRVPGDPQVWKNIPTNRPIGDKDNLFINMPKFKTHNLGLTTLSIKNRQGGVPSGYGHYCNRWEVMEHLCRKSYQIDFDRDFIKNYYQNVESAFLKHRASGFKHYDYEQLYPIYEKKGGWEAFRKIKNDGKAIEEFMSDIKGPLMWDEQWSQRAIDSAKAITPDINIVEGIIGRDGSGFHTGRDELCNIVIVGIGTTEVDAVGTYIMGHDPLEIPYLRIAKERGLGENNLDKIDIYRIKDNDIIPLKNLSEIKRYSLGVNLHSWDETGERLFW
ncbi:MAG: DUF362 domain-containing protein [Candidatus Latescibacteria bacterium]|nr:DUF362 domain-containing protein [Candidatus Latescibacterota bacterium]